MLLDLVCMIGDILFALLTFPVRMALTWWQRFIYSDIEGTPDSGEVDGSLVKSTIGDKGALESVDPFSMRQPPGPLTQRDTNAPQNPRKVSLDRQHARLPSREVNLGALQPNHSIPNNNKQRAGQNGLQSHQIWYPPRSASPDEDADEGPPDFREGLNMLLETEEEARQREQAEEWRLYPPFPSAYPPTPAVISSSTLPANSTAAPRSLEPKSLFNIPEDPPQQDFRGSLLPPRMPLNPGFVDGLSDEYHNDRVHNNDFDEMIIDVESETDYEGEDDFDFTLRTPLQPLQTALLPITRASHQISRASSVASRSTTLTSTGGGSSLRTYSSSESLSSAPVSDLSSIAASKRPSSSNKTISARNRLQITEGKASQNSLREKTSVAPQTRRHITPHRRLPKRGRVQSHTEESALKSSETSGISEDISGENANSKKHITKRRKVTSPTRTINSARPVRRRVTRHIPNQLHPAKLPPPFVPRTSSRLRAASQPAPIELSQASLSSTVELAPNCLVQYTEE